MKSCNRIITSLIILTFIIQSVSLLNPIIESSSEQDLTSIKEDSLVVNYITHDPIIITSDDNFTDYGFSGNGTSTNPYLIENLEVSSLDHYFIDNGIWVEDTTKHFVIQNCLVSANSIAIFVTNVKANTAKIIGNEFEICLTGIDFVRAEGIVVDNNNLLNCESYGIKVSNINKNATISNNVGSNIEHNGIYAANCDNLSIIANEFTYGGSGIRLKNTTGYIRDNNCSRHEGNGIYMGSTDFDQPIYFWNNTCEHNDGSGIYASYVTEVENNTLNYNDEGLRVSGHVNIILNNTFRGNQIGADLDSFGTFSKNKCLRNRGTGLIFDDSHRFFATNITDNIFFANDYGIELVGHVEYANISNNLIQENDDYGIYITDLTENVTIHHNTFLNNSDGSSQGYDSETDNFWFDLDSEEGNYWSDWTGEGWYLIDGHDNADIYPLSEPLHERFIDPDPVSVPPNGKFPFFILIAFGIIPMVIIGIVVIVKYGKKVKI